MKFSEVVTKSLPWIAAAASGNVPALVIMAARAAGEALGTEIEATPEAISTAVSGATPDQMLKLKQADQDFAYRMREMGVRELTDLAKSDAAMVESVNATMRAEAAAPRTPEDWWQTGWRPFNGYVLGLASFVTVCGVLWISAQAIEARDFTAINAIPAIVAAIAMVLAIPGAAVGITAWHRGLMKRSEVEKP